MKYFISLFIITFLCCTASFSQLKEKKALELNKKHLKVDHDILSYKFNSLNDTVSFYSDDNGDVVKITTLINAVREYYYYDSSSEWPYLVKSESGNVKNVFFFNQERNTSLLFHWTKNGIPQDTDVTMDKDDNFFKYGRNLKILIENNEINPEKMDFVLSYIDSVRAIKTTPVSGEYISKDTVIIDDFDETETTFTYMKSDSTFKSSDNLISTTESKVHDEFNQLHFSRLVINDSGKEITSVFADEQMMEPSIRKRDDISKSTRTTIIKTKGNECFTGTRLTMDNTTFLTQWVQKRCD